MGSEPMQQRVQELGATGLSTSSLMNVAKAKGFEAGELVSGGILIKASYIIVSFDEDAGTVTLSCKGDKRRKISVYLQDLVDNYKLDALANTSLVNRSNRSKSSICITRANRRLKNYFTTEELLPN